MSIINENIGGYRILRQLGCGGMAVVYLAEHELLRKKFALKVLNYELARNSQIRFRFIKEARIMAEMSNSGIIKVNNLIDAGDIVAMVMEYIDGETLKEFLDRKSGLSQSEIREIFLQILSAVEYAHSHQIVHRDLKPGNFMMDRSGRVKLMDFGIAKSMDPDSSEFTETGMQMGTVMYMSPEQLENSKNIGSTSDIYSLGVVLWQMVAGKKPYDSNSLNSFQIQKRIQSDPLPKTYTLFDDIIQRATNKNPQHRFQTIGNFALAIDTAFRNSIDGPVTTQNNVERDKYKKPAIIEFAKNNFKKIALALFILIAAWIAILMVWSLPEIIPVNDQNKGKTTVDTHPTIDLKELKKKSRDELDKLLNTQVSGLMNDTIVKSENDSLLKLRVIKGVFVNFEVTKVVENLETPNENKSNLQNQGAETFENVDKLAISPMMVFVEGGTFMMGSNSCDDDEKPVHEVTLSSFSIGKYEVTQAQWRAVMGNNPSHFSGCDNCPVENVSWDDVQGFIRKLNSMTGKTYRLPTEAEWEYAARGGKQSRNYEYSGSDDIGAVAWYNGNSGSKTHEAGKKSPNELGIYDMSGNVWEWCSDWYGSYSGRSSVNPTGALSGQYRVSRGGGWFNIPQYCRVALRDGNSPDFRYINLGFRVVLVPVR